MLLVRGQKCCRTRELQLIELAAGFHIIDIVMVDVVVLIGLSNSICPGVVAPRDGIFRVFAPAFIM